jgi:fructose-1-phosphate kinase PfkB-like protein
LLFRKCLSILASRFLNVVTFTAIKGESWAWDGRRLSYRPAVPVEALSTAGAGDAFLAGMIAGIAIGLCVSEAHELASLVGSLSVTSPHTIHKGINRKTLFDCADLYDVALSERVKDVLSAPVPSGTYDDA